MTQEQKAKAYDEAVINGSRLWECGEITRESYEYIFPGLPEDEDERIRKTIIYHIKNCDDTIDEDTEKRMIAWLEKQGEQHPKFRMGDTIKKKSTGDIVTICEIDLKNREYRLSNTGFIPFKYEHKWELVEQKTADKVEPKFKVGDWIVRNDNGCICQITSIREDDYCLWPLDSDVEGYLKITDIDNEHHLWTIQDAKDGDVLVSKSGNKIFSYRGNLDLRGRPCAHYGIYKVYDGIRFSPCAIGNYFTSEEVFPATKEQRDLLFQKMHEAGYEWDAEKKELKEIEQNAIEPDDLIEESYQQQADDLIDMVTEKPAWDEEDERYFDLIITICEGEQEAFQKESLPYINIGEAIEWLKSLRPQNRWKPSDEQMWALSTLANIPESASDTCKKTAQELLEQLKELTE